MAKKISAATVSVDLVARSSSFSEVLDKAQRQAANSSNSIIKSLGAMEAASKAFEKKMNDYLWAPFKAFKKATAPFTIGLRQIQNSLANTLRPFKNLAVYVGGPFVNAFNQAKAAISSVGAIAVNVTKKMGFAAAALTVAFTAMTVSSVNSTLEINKAANKLGIPFQKLNAIGFAAASVGVSTEQAADAMKDLTAKIEDAAYAGSGALEPFFTRINQSAREWKKLDPAEQLMRFSEELSKMDYQSALYWADEVNDSMSDMAPLLHKGREYFEAMRKEAAMFGANINGIDGLKELSTVATRIQYTFRNMFSGVAAQFAPILLSGFDKGMNKFKTYVAENGGFENVIRQFSNKLVDSVGDFLNSIQTTFGSISSLFASFIETNNKMVDSFGGQKRQTGVASEPRQTLIDSANDEFKATQLAKHRVDILSAQLDQMQNISTLQAGMSREQIQSHNAQIKNIKSQISAEQQLADLYDQKLDTYNQQVELGNAELRNKPAGELYGDQFKASMKDLLSGGSRKPTPEELKQEAAGKKRKETVGQAEDKMMLKLGVDYKGQELALQAAQTTQTQMLDMLSEQQDKSLSINTAYDKKKTLLEETSSFRIAQFEADKTYAVELGQTDQIAAIEKKIAIEQDLNQKALTGLEAARNKDLLANERKQQQQIQAHRQFRQALLQIDIQNSNDKSQMEALEREREYDALERLYDNQLDAMTQNNEAEVQAYKDMLNEKKIALAEFYQHASELAIQKTEQEVADNEGSLARTWSYLDDDYTAKVDAQVGITDLRESDIDNASSTSEAVAAKAKADGISVTQAKAEQEAKQKANTLKLGGDLLAEGAKNNRKMFEANKMMNIANATIAMYTGATKAFEQWGYPYGAIASGLVIASGMMNIAQIKAQKFQGKAHKGMTEIDGTGDQSWILQGGERVIAKEQNVDLKNYLNEQRSSKGGSGDAVMYQTNHLNYTAVTADEIITALTTETPKFRRFIQSL